MIFKPSYTITNNILQNLTRIENIKISFENIPISPVLISSLRATAKIESVHYSTKIEGNRLTIEQVENTIANNRMIQSRERDSTEVQAYYKAINFIEKYLDKNGDFSEDLIKKVHSIVEGEKYSNTYRDGQNAIYSGTSNSIIYLPPEAKDVAILMKNLVTWVNKNNNIPPVILAGLVHYQFVTIHPYYDGNGRTARLIASFIMRKTGYGLKDIYSLEEYYAQDLSGYYKALATHPHHNYYEGRENADLTNWIDYFVNGVAVSFEKVQTKATDIANKNFSIDQHQELRKLDIKQRKILALFIEFAEITSLQIAKYLGISQQSGRLYANQWIKEGFLVVANSAKKSRKYKLAKKYEKNIKNNCY